jgi:hypothetical protein
LRMLWKDKSRRVVPKGGTTLRYPLRKPRKPEKGTGYREQKQGEQ